MLYQLGPIACPQVSLTGVLDKSGDWTDRMRDLAALNADFRVVVLFDNEKSGVDAFRVTWRFLAGIKPGTRVDVRFWQCETMRDEGDWKQLHSDLAETTAIIIAAKDDTALRSSLRQWKRGLSAETENGRLVVAVLERGIPFLLQTQLTR